MSMPIDQLFFKRQQTRTIKNCYKSTMNFWAEIILLNRFSFEALKDVGSLFQNKLLLGGLTFMFESDSTAVMQQNVVNLESAEGKPFKVQ